MIGLGQVDGCALGTINLSKKMICAESVFLNFRHFRHFSSLLSADALWRVRHLIYVKSHPYGVKPNPGPLGSDSLHSQRMVWLFDEQQYLLGFTMRRFDIKIADFVKKGFIADF